HYHQEVSIDSFQMNCDGIWKEGYDFTLKDDHNEISGDLRFEPLSPLGVLVYYNGRVAVAPSLSQRFYDMFALKVTGEVEIQGEKLTVQNGRGIIEHGIGIFSNQDIEDWRWLNLQFPNGSVHLFYHTLNLKEEGILESGEGAAVFDGTWYHFLRGEFQIIEKEYAEEKGIPSKKIPIAWKVIAGNQAGDPLLELEMSVAAKYSWHSELSMTKEDQSVSNYVLKAEGTWMGKPIKGKGTMENQMHRIIE
ncbi:MAG: hypothetical protein ACFFD4_32950, partial [Candidatus Odinarchaeota archaeon]